MSITKNLFKRKVGVVFPNSFDYENSIKLRDWARTKLSQSNCIITPSDLIDPTPVVRENANLLRNQSQEDLRSQLQKAVRRLNRRWTNSTGPG